MLGKIVLLLFGVFFASTAVLIVKATHIHPVFLSALRLLGAAVVLTPLFLRDTKNIKHYFSTIVLPSLFPGVLLGLHFLTWIFGARLTLAVNSTLIVNMLPVVMPFFGFLMYREILTVTEVAGTLIALTGITLLGIKDFQSSPGTFSGDILCIISMLFYALYLALARKNNQKGTIWQYIVPLFYTGGIFCLVISFFIPNGISPLSGKDILMIIFLVLVPTIGGHTILNYSMRKLRSQIVSLLNLAQFLFAGVMAFIFFKETPPPYFYIASVFILAGGITTIAFMEKGIPPPSRQPHLPLQ